MFSTCKGPRKFFFHQLQRLTDETDKCIKCGGSYPNCSPQQHMVTNDASKIYKLSSDKDYNYHYQVLDYEVNAIRVMAEVDFNTSVNDMAEGQTCTYGITSCNLVCIPVNTRSLTVSTSCKGKDSNCCFIY